MLFFSCILVNGCMSWWWFLFRKRKRPVASKAPTPMPTIPCVYATDRAKAANVKLNVAAITSAVACVTKMVNEDERVDFYPSLREVADFQSIKARLPAVGLDPRIKYNTY